MNLDLSYVPTARERRRAVMSPWFVRLHYAGLAGGVLALAGGHALSGAAARHGETQDAAALAILGGVILLAYPVMLSLWAFHAQLRRRAEWHVQLTPAHIRVEVEGIVTEIPWDRMERVRELRNLWVLRGRCFCVALPKRAVPAEKVDELGGFLRSAADAASR